MFLKRKRTGYRVFAALLPGASLESAFLALEAFRKSLAEGKAQLVTAVTVTVGVAQYPRDARTVQTLMQAADAALVAAKEAGRKESELLREALADLLRRYDQR